MFPLAHLAAGYLAGRLWNRLFPNHQLNSVLAMLGGLLPDLLDKPLSFVPGWESSRSIGHTVLFCVTLFLLSKGYTGCRPLGLGVATHLLLDNPFTYQQTLLWPALGPAFRPGDDLSLEAFLRHLREPAVGGSEIVGGIVLLIVGARHAAIAFGWIQVHPPTTLHERRESALRERVEKQRSEQEGREPDGPPGP